MFSTYTFGPLVLLAGFALWFFPANQRFETRLQAQLQATEQRVAAERAQRELREQIVRENQERIRVEREAELARREQREREAEQALDAALLADLATAHALTDRLRDEISALEARLTALHTRNEQTATELFQARHALEELLIARRNADLELQYATQALAHTVEAPKVAEEPLFPRPPSTRL